MRPVYLIGFMGAGKSTVGKRLAAKMGVAFVDMDILFEEKYRLSIQTFFNKYGETLFRQFEYELLKSTFKLRDVVISTGGGTPCYFDAIEGMNKNGTTIYLQMAPAALASRLVSAKRQRPLLDGKTTEELSTYIVTKLEERKVWYVQAKLIVDALHLDVVDLIRCIEGCELEDDS